MAIMAKGSKEMNFELAPKGTYTAICTNVYDLGRQETEYNGEKSIKPQVVIRWEINSRMEEGNLAGKRFLMSKKYTNSLHEKAVLRKDLESWLNIDFKESQVIEGYDLEQLIKKPCMITITHKESKGKTYANIASVTSVPEGMVSIEIENDVVEIPKWITELQEKQIKQVEGEKESDDFSDVPF